MIIGGATVNQIPLDWNNNVSNILSAITQAKKEGIRILCLPELCLTGYGCEDLFLSEWVSEKAWTNLLSIVPHTESITVSIGLPIRIGSKTYNGACVISHKEILGISLKQNLPKDGVHYEHRWFEEWPPHETTVLGGYYNGVKAGDLIYDVEGIRFGFEICEDAWRKEKRPGYRLLQRKVNLILNPSASHFAMGKSLLREQEVVIDGSAKFQCVYVFTNLLGNEAGRMIYDGDIIIGQHGKLLAVNKRLSFKPFNVLACDVDFEQPDQSKPVRSLDNKEVNDELAQAASLALWDYLRKSRAGGFVLSLSGGADSSLCAVLVAEMVKRASGELGWEEFYRQTKLSPDTISGDWHNAVRQLLTCAYQGTKNSSNTTFDAAQFLATSIGATFHHWTIDDEVNSYSTKIERALARKLSWETDDVTLQNIQARSRSPIIWMLANVKRAVLLTTSNRSEGDVGYATMDGDTSGSLAPIAGLTKTFILTWLRWAEVHLNHVGLSKVNALQPTAELRPLERNQTDEADLMPYPVLAKIEGLAIRDRLSPMQVFIELKKELGSPDAKRYVIKFFRMWSANQWKRERLAPSFHLDDINVDPRSWCRFPILSSGFGHELLELEKQ